LLNICYRFDVLYNLISDPTGLGSDRQVLKTYASSLYFIFILFVVTVVVLTEDVIRELNGPHCNIKRYRNSQRRFMLFSI